MLSKQYSNDEIVIANSVSMVVQVAYGMYYLKQFRATPKYIAAGILLAALSIAINTHLHANILPTHMHQGPAHGVYQANMLFSSISLVSYLAQFIPKRRGARGGRSLQEAMASRAQSPLL